MIDPIDPLWLQNYLDQLIRAAALFPEGSDMRASALLRVQSIQDMVQQWKERKR